MVLSSASHKTPATSTITFTPFTLQTSDPYYLLFYYYIITYSTNDEVTKMSEEGQNMHSPPYIKYSLTAGNTVIDEGVLEQKLGVEIWYSKCLNLPVNTAEAMTFSVTGYDIYSAIDDISLHIGNCSGKFYFNLKRICKIRISIY